MKNICVFASGFGSNFQAIIDACKKKKIKKGHVTLLITDNKNAYARQRARKAGIDQIYCNPKDFPSKKDWEKHLGSILKKHRIDLVVLAGFMRILSPYFVRQFMDKTINIHPALLPAFPGAHAIKDAFDYGVKVTGVTVHFIDEKVDHGPIILQESLEVKKTDSLKTLEKKIHKVEHRLYPKAINILLSGKYRIRNSRKVSL